MSKKISVEVDDVLYNRIERYWHNRRFSNRSDALKILLNAGLEQLEYRRTAQPTQKQIDYVNKICDIKHITPPEEFTIVAYSKFIEENKLSKEKKA